MEVALMRMPDSLAALVDYGIIQEVIRPLMSGKEAQVFLVVSEGQERVAKVYKEAEARTFKHRAEYTEGRKTRNSRDQRAMTKRTRHGRAKDEAAWRTTEVDMIHRLRDAGVRVPEPHEFIDGVLVMELIKDAAGNPAPRLGDLTFESERASEIYEVLIGQVVRMLCAGVVHGDLSVFNVLLGADGPAMIDFPQSVDPASNQNARRLLLRDVDNLHSFLERFAPHAKRSAYAEEMWELYQGNRLRPTTKLRGGYRAPRQKTNTADVLALIGDANEEERERREGRGERAGPRPHRTVVDLANETPRTHAKRGKRSAKGRGRVAAKSAKSASAKSAGAKKKSRRKRRRTAGSAAKSGSSATSQSAGHGPAGQRPASAKPEAGSAGNRRVARATAATSPGKKRARRRRRPPPRRPSS